jgi:hypothetical protein
MPDNCNRPAQPGQMQALQPHVRRRPPTATATAQRVHLQRHSAADGSALRAVATGAVVAALTPAHGGRRPDGNEDVDGVAGSWVLRCLLRLQAESLVGAGRAWAWAWVWDGTGGGCSISSPTTTHSPGLNSVNSSG